MANAIFSIDAPVLVLIGPTAVGKTDLSLAIADSFGCEIISVDSMQIYRYMDIGTAKVTAAERHKIPHHLIDIIPPDSPYDANRFVEDAESAMKDIVKRGKVPLLTGGTGLYLRSLIEGLFAAIGDFPEIRDKLKKELDAGGISKMHEVLRSVDPGSAERVHPNDTHRVLRALEIYQGTGRSWSSLIEEHKKEKNTRFKNILLLGLTCSRERLYERINCRTELMLKQGLREEVEWLLKKGYSSELQSMQGIGYKHMVMHLQGKWDYDTTKEYISRDTRRYAKRQFTWFKKMDIEWFERDRSTSVLSRIERFLV